MGLSKPDLFIFDPFLQTRRAPKIRRVPVQFSIQVYFFTSQIFGPSDPLPSLRTDKAKRRDTSEAKRRDTGEVERADGSDGARWGRSPS
jgi:hypothetical protein